MDSELETIKRHQITSVINTGVLTLLPLFLTSAVLSGCGGGISSSSSDDSMLSAGNTLVINEVVSKDGAGGDDWIELYVTEGTVNLGDYSLIDDNEENELQRLPDVTLSAGEYVIINAIDEEDADDQTGYYVTFKLGSSDSVSLYNDSSLVDYIAWDKGEALSGFSYGRYINGTGSFQTLSPTKAASNVTASRGPLIINEVVSKDDNGGNDWFELYNAGTTSIDLSYYSVVDDTDEQVAASLPNVSLAPGEYIVIYASELGSSGYYVPFNLGSSDSLTLELDGITVDYIEWDESDAPQGYSYGAYPDGAWISRTLDVSQGASNVEASAFDRDIVDSIYITLTESDWLDLVINSLDKKDYYASVTYKGVTLDEVAFRTKGNSTLSQVAASGSERFSFKIDTNEYVSGQKLLNLKKLNLNNNYNDPTYMRETISYDVMRNLGVPAPRTSFVNLYINNELHGLYTMVEQVDSEFLERNFVDPDGDLYKPDDADNEGLQGHDLVWIDAAFDSYSAIELKSNEDVTQNNALIVFLDEINNGSDFDDVVNSDVLLRYLAASTAMSNLDSYQGTLSHNYYLYEEDGAFSIIPWDFNESFGTFTMGCGDVTALYIDEPTQGALSERPLIAALLSNDENLQTYHGYINDLISGDLNPDNLEQAIDDIADLIRTHVGNDPTAFYTMSQFETGLNYDVGQIPGLLSFAIERADSIQDQLDGRAPSSGDGSGYCGASTMPSGPVGRPPM